MEKKKNGFSPLVWVMVYILAIVGMADQIRIRIAPSAPFYSKDKSVSRVKTKTSNYPKRDMKFVLKYLESDGVEAQWNIEGEGVKNIKNVVLYRSAANFEKIELDLIKYPIVLFDDLPVAGQGSYQDKYCADDIEYYYFLEFTDSVGGKYYSPVKKIKVPGKKLAGLGKPVFHVDKVHYLMEVFDGDKLVKRYPVVLGRNPADRKFYQGSNTTPEGVYYICNLQPEATYYRAYDINYPNDIDKFRYKFALREGLLPGEAGRDPGIGGEIQIHGSGRPDFNWTAGCINLRNSDMDELFSHSEILCGTSVIITGFEFTLGDMESIKENSAGERLVDIQKKLYELGYYKGKIDGVLGNEMMRSIGKFQVAKKLPFSCQLDKKTVNLLRSL